MRIKDARQTFLGIWIRRLVEGETFEVWNGAQKRDLTYIDDAVEAILMAAASDSANGQVFNTGGDGPITLKELAELIIQVHGKGAYEIKPFPTDLKAIDIDDYYADFSRIRSCLGWEPSVGLREGLRRTLAFYQQHLEHYI
jgi:UDP-glucose 4-epimerase